MKKSGKWIMASLLAAALLAAILHTASTARIQIDGLAAMAAGDGGKTWVALYERNNIAFYMAGYNGVMQKSFTIPRRSGAHTVQIAHMSVDSEGTVYYIKHYSNASTGQLTQRQELGVYTPKIMPLGRMRNIRLDNRGNSADIRYMHIHISTSLLLTGVSDDGFIREVYDIDAVKDGGNTVIRGTREYPAAPGGEGVYKAVASGANVAFISKTGSVFLSEENAAFPTRIYPDYMGAYTTYASFIHESAPGQVIIGEQRSGNILRLYTDDGRVEYIAEGNRSLGGLTYTGRDILEMSFSSASENAWTAVVQDSRTGVTALAVNNNGEVSLITEISRGAFGLILAAVGRTVLYLLLILALIGAVLVIRKLVVNSRTIFLKLLFGSIPLLVLALVLFGAYSYVSYRGALLDTYITKVEDQGNLLRALVSGSSFDQISAPDMYGSIEYNYLRTIMGTRDVHTSSAYFVDGSLYTGVEDHLPALYPFGIRHSPGAWDLFRAAALTGEQQSGVITDRFGDRIVCITPVGSSWGNAAFLLETGVFQSEIDRQTAGFIRNYLIISLLCLVSACALLFITFRRTLKPLAEIAEGLDQFSKGNRYIRLESKTNDELADISRVFNKMARDIDTQIYNLKTMGDTYYRFVPQQIFHLLGKENLADVSLGSAVEGKFPVLAANLYLRQGLKDFESIRELTNLFFAIVHGVAGDNGATLLTDSAGLRDLWIICPDGSSAVKTAMEAIAGFDEHNARASISKRLDVSFFLHSTDIAFGICGDEGRYVPAMTSPDLDEMLHQCEDFRRLSSRLIVTEAVSDVLESSIHPRRFIGYAGNAGENAVGLYDFYGSSSANMIRMFDETLLAFEKSITLYVQGRYYDAKNMFAAVLRENQYDNVARHYIFQCEKKLDLVRTGGA